MNSDYLSDGLASTNELGLNLALIVIGARSKDRKCGGAVAERFGGVPLAGSRADLASS